MQGVSCSKQANAYSIRASDHRRDPPTGRSPRSHILLGAQIALRGLDRRVPQQELNLLQFPAILPAQLGAGAAQVVRGYVLQPYAAGSTVSPRARRHSRRCHRPKPRHSCGWRGTLARCWSWPPMSSGPTSLLPNAEWVWCEHARPSQSESTMTQCPWRICIFSTGKFASSARRRPHPTRIASIAECPVSVAGGRRTHNSPGMSFAPGLASCPTRCPSCLAPFTC